MPEQIWGMTPAEFQIALWVKHEEEKEAWFKMAWMTAHIMNATGRLRKPVTIQRLIGPLYSPRPKRYTDEEYKKQKKALEELANLFPDPNRRS